jgi:hypothetical protein
MRDATLACRGARMSVLERAGRNERGRGGRREPGHARPREAERCVGLSVVGNSSVGGGSRA